VLREGKRGRGGVFRHVSYPPFFAVFWMAARLVPVGFFAFGLFLVDGFAFAARFGCLPAALAFPRFVIGLLALPLCGAAPTSLCRLQREVGKRKQLKPQILKRVPRTVTVEVHLESAPSRIRRE
jgi:hypothetical protein